MTQGPNALSLTFILFEKFSLFLERFGNLDFLSFSNIYIFLIFFGYIYMNEVYLILHETLESKK